jgi:hypothetical protein
VILVCVNTHVNFADREDKLFVAVGIVNSERHSIRQILSIATKVAHFGFVVV